MDSFVREKHDNSGTLCVREAELGDLQAIAAIYAHHVSNGTGTFEESPPSLAEMTTRWQSLHSESYPYLVAVYDKELAGFAYAGPYKKRSAYRFTVEDSIYISPQYQRLGVGKALLSGLIQCATDLGYQQMMAVIGDSDNVGSIGLHQAAGFKSIGIGIKLGFKHDRWLDIVYMQRPLV